jgi:hypothetical protein
MNPACIGMMLAGMVKQNSYSSECSCNLRSEGLHCWQQRAHVTTLQVNRVAYACRRRLREGALDMQPRMMIFCCMPHGACTCGTAEQWR